MLTHIQCIALNTTAVFQPSNDTLGYITTTLLQGDGTAFIFQDKPAVFTLSVHAANNFPARKQKSTLDVPLPDGMGDDEYLR